MRLVPRLEGIGQSLQVPDYAASGRGKLERPTPRITNDTVFPQKSPRPGDSWAICDSGLGLVEEAVKFAAGRIEGALILFRAVVDQWPAVGPNHITNKLLGRDLS